MDNQHTVIYPKEEVFDNRYVDHKALYLALYNTIPDLNYFYPLSGEKAFMAFKEKYASQILTIHRYRWYKQEKKRYEFDETIIQMNGKVTVKFSSTYCQILHDGSMDELITEITTLLLRFKERKKREPREINLVVKGFEGLELKPMEIKQTKLDIGLYYEDDFRGIDETIRKRLGKKNDKGIVLLHGLPGTGKTTYLRHLVSKLNKQVIFLSPNVAGSITDPTFIELLIDNPNSVVVIEDAENIIMDRKLNSSSAVSNLLNISDGLLADFLNVQLICTFNSSLTLIDSALMRKGRLIAKYEFGKLSVEKAQRLSRKLGYDVMIDKPMTLAEITNPNEQAFEVKQVEVIGFRRAVFSN